MTMRYFTFSFEPLEQQDFHPVIADAKSHPEINLEQMTYINLFPDRSGVVLVGGRGSEEAAEEVLEAHPKALDWELIPGDPGLYAYVHFAPAEPAVGLLELLEKYQLLLSLPMRFTSDGSLQVTVIGSDENIQQALMDVPAAIDAEPIEMGAYTPDDDRAIAGLTDRQREVLNVAVDLGYYEVPRQATYEDIAESLDCTVGTVGEHLNRIEARIIGAAVD